MVEDNSINQQMACLILERAGAQVQVADNGREALRRMDQQPFDLIFMDCQMPEMDGYEATGEIRARESRGDRKRVRIIAMTANAMPDDRERCLAAGMDDYLSKPIRRAQVLEMLQRWGPGRASSLP